LGDDIRGLRDCGVRGWLAEKPRTRLFYVYNRITYVVFLRPLFELHAGFLGYVCRGRTKAAARDRLRP